MVSALVLVGMLVATPDVAVELEVFVPLCDNALIACGRAPAGAPRALDTNLYWGAAYGAERYLSRAPGFRVVERMAGAADGPVLRRLVVERAAAVGEQRVRLTLYAYAGDRIDAALEDFLRAAAGGSRADLVVWAGHDRLMDRPPPALQAAASASARPVAVLACMSEQYFGPVLEAVGARPVVLTRTLMAPEAYLLEALASAVARHGATDATALRAPLVAAYARHQRISLRAAGSVFSKVRAPGPSTPR